MKTLSIILILILSACSSPTEEKKDKDPMVVAPIADINIEEGQETSIVQLNTVFDDPDDENTEMILTILSNSNNSLLSASISGTTLTINYNLTNTGTSTITIQAESNTKFVTDEFTVTVTENGAAVSLAAGISSLTNKDWSSAENDFQAAIDHGDDRYKEEAYLGLGFAKLKLYDHVFSYINLNTGLNLSDNIFNDDFNMLICILEFSYKRNYTNAINKGLALLSSNSFSFHFDSSINEKDIRVTVAMSYYNLNDYTNALAQAKILDSSITLEESDADFHAKLANELNRLSGEYHSKK